MKNKSKLFENISKLLNENSPFIEGDKVKDKDNNEGVITLSKNPFYAVKLDKTGITKSYNFDELELIPSESSNINNDHEEFIEKYDTSGSLEDDNINESSASDIIKLEGLLIIYEDLNISEILSDIRSISGITTVKNTDIPGTYDKAKLSIKIDPFPFKNDLSSDDIKKEIKHNVRQIPGVKNFWTKEDYEKPKEEPLDENKIIKFKIRS